MDDHDHDHDEEGGHDFMSCRKMDPDCHGCRARSVMLSQQFVEMMIAPSVDGFEDHQDILAGVLPRELMMLSIARLVEDLGMSKEDVAKLAGEMFDHYQEQRLLEEQDNILAEGGSVANN